MVKQPAMESSEFTMSHEDFPALPGSTPSQGGGGSMAEHLHGHHASNGAHDGNNDRMTSQGLHQDHSNLGVGTAVSQAVSQDGGILHKKGIQTSPDGKIIEYALYKSIRMTLLEISNNFLLFTLAMCVNPLVPGR